MPQEHHVLRCFSCETFQVHIVKKSPKWECKICGEKQSVKRNYGKGSGKDCRNQVMKLNERQVLQGNSSKLTKCDEASEETFIEELKKDRELGREKSFKSKWTEYLDENTASGGSESEDTMDCLSEMVLTKKRSKKQPKNSQNSTKKICRNLKKSSELSSKVCDELNPSFNRTISDGTFESSDKKSLCEIKTQKSDCEKYPTTTTTTNALKHGKYAKYMDDDEDDNDATQVNKSSNIFNSHLDDLDNILNF